MISINAKTKKGNKIKKLPAAYPIINEYEKDFKKEYINNLKIFMKLFKEKTENWSKEL